MLRANLRMHKQSKKYKNNKKHTLSLLQTAPKFKMKFDKYEW